MKTSTEKPAIFITATDTGVGKTTITGALTLALGKTGHQVGIMKPIETGVDPQQPELSDANRLRSLFSPSPLLDSICLYRFPEPLAPLACARKAGTMIALPSIVSSFHTLIKKYSCLLLEGAGGVFTPITPDLTMRDLMISLNLPVIVASRTSLGSINHLLLTLETLRMSGIHIRGVVLNTPKAHPVTEYIRQQHASTVELIKELSPVPVFGPLEHIENMQTDWQRGVEALSAHPEIQRLATHVISMTP